MKLHNRFLLIVHLFVFLVLPLRVLKSQEQEITHKSTFDSFVRDTAISVVYVPDLKSFGDKLSTSAFGKFWRDPNAQPWREAVEREWTEMTKTMLDPLPILGKSDSALLVFQSIEDSNVSLSNFPVGLICKLGEKGKGDIQKYIEVVFKEWSLREGTKFQVKSGTVQNQSIQIMTWDGQETGYIALQDDFFILSLNKVLIQDILTGKSVNLQWQDCVKRSFNPGDDIFIWFDFPVIIRKLLESPSIPREQQPVVEMALQGMGLTAIKYHYAVYRLKGVGIETEAGFVFVPERSGIFSLFKPVPFIKILELVEFPDKLHGAVSYVSPLENLQLARQRARELGGEQATTQIDMSLAMIQMMTGFNIEHDILSLFGTQTAFVINGPFDGAIVAELKNPSKFDELFVKLALRFQLQKLNYEFKGFNYFQMAGARSRIPLYFGRTDTHMVVASSHLLIREVLAQVKAGEKATRGRNVSMEKEPTLVAKFYSPPSDLSFITSIGDILISSLNRRPEVLKHFGSIDPLLIPDYVVLMDHSSPINTELHAGKDYFKAVSTSAYGLSGELLPLVPVLIKFVKGAMTQFAKPALAGNARIHAQTCRENLLKIDAVKEQWALEHNIPDGTSLPDDFLDRPEVIGPDGYLKTKPVCPAGGTYTLNPIGTLPECSIGSSLAPADKNLWHVFPE